jgi:hypothetical protein
MTCHIVHHNTHVECPCCKKNTYTTYLCHPRFNTPYHTFCPKCQRGYDCPDCTEIQRAKQERAEKERAEKERAEKERAEKERAEKERAEKERADKQKEYDAAFDRVLLFLMILAFFAIIGASAPKPA